jgi:hypothetical protein
MLGGVAARMNETAQAVEAAYLGALNAPDRDVEAAVDAGASVIAAAPGGLAAAEALAGRVVRACGDRGWLAADLVRMARRELGAAHVRPAEQLSGGGGLRLERLDRFGAATCVLELLRLWGRLPRITPPAVPAGDRRGGEHKLLGRIRALLAKAESTVFPEEAEALSAKAQHLMARHSIDEALLAGAAGAGATGDGPGARRVGVDPPYEGAKALLLDAVAAANRCQAVWSSEFGFSTVVGYEADLEAVELLYTSLLVQADKALNRGRSRSKNFRQSFLIAYAGRIRERLAAATGEAAAEAAEEEAAEPRLLPVLAAREVAVGVAAQRMFPETTTHRLRVRDGEGWEHGKAAADRAALGR